MKHVSFTSTFDSQKVRLAVGPAEEVGRRFKLDIPDNAVGCTFFDDVVTIWLPEFEFEPYWLGVLVHECVHAATFILDRIGIPAINEDRTDEALAYKTEEIFENLVRKIKSRGF